MPSAGLPDEHMLQHQSCQPHVDPLWHMPQGVSGGLNLQHGVTSSRPATAVCCSRVPLGLDAPALMPVCRTFLVFPREVPKLDHILADRQL